MANRIFSSLPLIIFRIPFFYKSIFPNCFINSSKSSFGQIFNIFKSIIFNPL
ncbi:hypothetical protein GLOIN_2v1720541 [Rhizophagus irregularis DAOM 181602=DAOM 197198]|uniref:Uncharacterized protein n=1 Tax=Rhizophagus irregularis (strain DAOM 181602 / DAOM 197198 / MUCL 43194) TaxID=747089 RepID=A0A2P4P2P9_RHIID|nr:hypothetical protein GLOIN_2v1720541 [Rhizophagus irregularis DAOM 181602=DAOM 197198]POG59644.1 hypothetical protein GLOIN_2v1720541 [Rhizophagus irregularis DAOM 181602=DAOM 197198]|eukprot:XP_025166510.1 hypothetical protein GLOIN_2v1720541 [Rhizophagus irregularis DAOM 181602=DAOM 197198]